jgi:hypothetical protein
MPWRNVRADRFSQASRLRAFGALTLCAALVSSPSVVRAEEESVTENVEACDSSDVGAGGAVHAGEPETWEKDPLVDQSLSQELRDPRYRFCHQAGYRLWPHQKQLYCPPSKELEGRCPELVRACQRPAWGDDSPPPEEDGWSLFDWLPNLSWLVRLLFWGGLAAVLFFLGRALARHIAEEVRRRRAVLAPVPLDVAVSEPDAPRETNVDRLLERAKAEAARGDFAAALASAHAAALHALGDRSLIKLHRSRTNGDYLRQLGEHRAEREQMRHIVREVEAVQFGHADADAATFSRVLAAVSALTGRLAVLCLCFLGSVSLVACDSKIVPESPASPTSPDGHALLEALLTRHSKEVRRRVQRINDVPTDVTRFVALGPSLRDQEWERLLTWVDGGGTLVTTGIPHQLAEALHLGEVKTTECKEPLDITGLHLSQAGGQAFDHPDAPRLVDCGKRPFMIEIGHGAGSVVALADDAFLRNANLAAADNAQLIVQLAAAPDGKVELLGPWTGSGTRDPLETIRNAGLTPWLLQLLLLALGYVAWRGVRFGTPREPVRDTRRAFVEHAEALATQYGRAKASGYALESYGRWAALRLRQRVPVRERDLHALAHAIARRTNRDPMTTLKILVDAQAADQLASDPEEHARTMDELSRLLNEVGGPR